MAKDKDKVVSEKSETTKIKCLESCAGLDFSLSCGEVKEINSVLAEGLIKHGLAQKV